MRALITKSMTDLQSHGQVRTDTQSYKFSQIFENLGLFNKLNLQKDLMVDILEVYFEFEMRRKKQSVDLRQMMTVLSRQERDSRITGLRHLGGAELADTSHTI